MNTEEHSSTFRKRFAEIVSIMTTAPLLALVPFIVLNHRYTSLPLSLLYDALTVAFGTLFPVLITMLWAKTTSSRGWDIPERKDRFVPLAAGVMSYLIGALTLSLTGAPEISVALMLCYGTNTLTVMVISVWWKISVHAMGVMGPSVALAMVFGPIGALMGLILPIVMWSRIELKKHTSAQVVVGAVLGLLLTYGQMVLFVDPILIQATPVEMAGIAYGLAGPSIVLGLSGAMNQSGVPDRLTRKFFHFIGFGSLAVYAHFLSPLLFNLFLVSGIVYVGTACAAGDGYVWYNGVRRKSDRPNDRLYVILPMVSMVIAIGVANLVFAADAVLAGILCVAIGDAVAEPVGATFGKHQYKVVAIVGERTTRTVEGSVAVAIATGTVLGLMTGHVVWSAVAGITLAGIEALSPRGTDNFTVFVVASGLMSLILAVS